MASLISSLLLSLGYGKLFSANYGGIYCENIRGNMIWLVLGASRFFLHSMDVKGAGLPPVEKPKLCDNACEKELENVPMVTTESGLQYKNIKVGARPNPPIGF